MLKRLRHTKEIIRLAIPNILSNVSVPLLSTVDTALMGHLSMAHLGAVGLGTMIFNFLYWNFGFLRMGTTGLVAQAYGREDKTQWSEELWRGVLMAVVIAILLIGLREPLLSMSLRLMDVGSEHFGLVGDYFHIRIWAAPAALLSYVIFGWLFGMQNALIPLILTVTINIINILLSYILVFQYGLGIEGVAWSTVVAQYVGVISGIAFILWKYRSRVEGWNKRLLSSWSSWFSLLRLHSDLLIRTLCLSGAIAFFFKVSSSHGALVLAGNVVLFQLVHWMSYGIDGFAYAAESLTGKYYGQKDTNSLNTVIKEIFLWSAVMALIYTLLYAIFGGQLIRIFSSEVTVWEYGDSLMPFVVVLPLIAFPCYIWDGIFIGLTRSKLMRDSMMLALLVYIVTYFTLKDFNNDMIWYSFLIFLGIRGVVQHYYWVTRKLA